VSPKPLTVLVVDDHEVVRAGIAAALADDSRFEVIAAVGSAADALGTVRRSRVDVALVDLRLPDACGTDLCRRLLHTVPVPRVILFSSYVSEDVVRSAREAGADAYVSKADGLAALREALERVADRASPLPIVAQLHELVGARRTRGLTSQHERMLELAAQGLTYHEIGARLFISESTVRFHMQKLKARFGARSKTDLVARALRSSAIAPADEFVGNA
jgi:DNA-binding NarL/FixJ family response regulator